MSQLILGRASNDLVASKADDYPLRNRQDVVELGCGWRLPATHTQKRYGAKVSTSDADNQVKCYQQLIHQVNSLVIPFFQRSF